MGHRSRSSLGELPVQSRQLKASHRATFFQEILGQPAEFEELAFCNSL
jgi:hypothetical protein